MWFFIYLMTKARGFMEKRKQITRTCTHCGMLKPLSAFLHISGTQGTLYGSICSTCRGAGAKEKLVSTVLEEDRGSTSTEVSIGAKQKVGIEKEKKRQLDDSIQQEITETKKRDQLLADKERRADLFKNSEKDVREAHAGKKQPKSFLNYLPTDKKAATTQNKVKQSLIEKQQINEQTQTTETIKLEEAIKVEQKNTTIDLSVTFLANPQLQQTRFQASSFKNWKAMIGNTPIGRSIEQMWKKTAPETPKTTKDPLIDYIDKTMGPSRKR